MGTGSSKQSHKQYVRPVQTQMTKCPVTGRQSFVKLKNLADEGVVYTDTLHNKIIENMTCTPEKCTGSVMGCLGLKMQPEPRQKKEVLIQARDFMDQYFSFNKKVNSVEHIARWKEVEHLVKTTGTYELTFEELDFGVKQAWRNAPRCIGRIQWSNLQLFDARHVRTAREMFDAICNQIIYATNGGNIRSAITVFPKRTDGKHDFRVWNKQLITYAGYKQEDGSVIGDPINVPITEICQGLGWKGKGGMFDVLPIILQANGEDPEYFEYPEEIILQVPLKHPNYPWFEELGFHWYAVPAVANMMLDCGGIEFPGAPFNGWYMGTEIGTRDLCDPQRFNLLEVIGKKMGLDTRQITSLWKDRVLVEVNYAVLHSYTAQGVTISDHHSASESFMTFMKNEQRQRGGCPADWVWIVPPTSGSITPVFHQEMLNYKVKPSFEYMLEGWFTHVWRKENPLKWLERNKKLTFKVVAKAVRFASRLFVRALSKRTKCTIVYATETGIAERFARTVYKMFTYGFNCRVMCMDEYKTETITREELFIIVTSTFGNGDPPENGKKFAKFIAAKHREHKRGGQNGVMNRVSYAVFGLGSRAYPKYCAFAHTLDDSLSEIGAKRLFKCGEGDALSAQEQALQSWSVDCFKTACNQFKMGDTHNINAATSSLNIVDLTWTSGRFRLAEAPMQTESNIATALSMLHARPVHTCEIKDRKQLQSQKSERETILVTLSGKKGRELAYQPGDHVAFFPANSKKIVDGVIKRIKNLPPKNQLVVVEMLLRGTSAQRPSSWENFGKIPPCKIETALTRFFDLTTPPSQTFLKGLSLQEMSAEDKKKVETLANDNKKYEQWRTFNYFNLLEILEEFPSIKLDATFLMTQLPVLQPRYYSISSSPRAHPNEIHATVAVVKYKTQGGNGPEHEGVCSTWLNNVTIGEKLACIVRAAENFHIPQDKNAPVILIGPGTGIAPLRSFWHHRQTEDNKNKALTASLYKEQAYRSGKWYLYFGCRQSDVDNIYGDELIKAKNNGTFTDVYLALSREPGQPKTYVQDLIKRNADEVYEVLVHKKGHVYVCGDVEMADEVVLTITNIVKEKGQMSDYDAEDYILAMKYLKGRVYSPKPENLQDLRAAVMREVGKEENRIHEDIFGVSIKTVGEKSKAAQS